MPTAMNYTPNVNRLLNNSDYLRATHCIAYNINYVHMKATGVLRVVPICGLAAFPIR